MYSPRIRRRLTLACVALAGAALIGSATPVLASSAPASAAVAPAAAAAHVTVTGGQTTTVSTPELGKALLGAGILPLPVGKAKLTGIDLKTVSLTITMPIVGGTLNPAYLYAGDIDHSGGLQFLSLFSLRTVTVSDFVVYHDSNSRLVATVNRDPKQKVTLFKVDLSGLKLTTGPGRLGLANVGLTMTDEGAALLNSKLKTKVFTAGQKFGTANTTVLFQ
jgi:hypothetical protein